MPRAKKPSPASKLLFVGTHGHVTAISKSNGRRVWSTSLPKTGYGVVSILPEDGQLHCACGGYVFALDPLTGEILWTNSLRGLGNGIVYLATMQNDNAEAMATLAAQAAANAGAAAASGAAH